MWRAGLNLFVPAIEATRALLGWNGEVPNIADRSSRASREIATNLLDALGANDVMSHTGQTAGTALERAVHDFLAEEMPTELADRTTEVKRGLPISHFAQYEHLAQLTALIAEDPTATLKAVIGTDYLIKPDVTVGVQGPNDPVPHLHAAVPCKWTLRSDRAQNVRHEAVSMIRHRRGRLPHIVAVTAEPMPSRIASLARGTAEVDAVYHVALDELANAVQASGFDDQVTILAELVTHNRLRDLSELPETLTL